jgi:dihydrofolate synthase/folylpolyglutamate synthase
MTRTRGETAAEILFRLERFGIKLGLSTTRELLESLGRPQKRYPTVLVAGTNGKGSTAALLASMATAAGYRVGLFTSPHLESVRERLRIDGRGISAAELTERLARVVEIGERRHGQPPSYFEALCISALEWYADRAVDLAVLEVGLGGRLDATNVCDPSLSVITMLGLDHQEVLGHAIEEIAREKAGILRAGRPALSGVTGPGLDQIRRRSDELGASLIELEQAAEIRSLGESPERQSFVVLTANGRHTLEIGLPGAHQRNNAALATVAAETLAAGGLDRLDGDAITRGAATCRWPGRLERVKLADGHSLLLDGAHNASGARALASFLGEHFKRPVVVFGALRRKNAAAMLEELSAVAERVVVTRPPSERAEAPAALEAALSGRVEVREKPAEALDRAMSVAERVVVCGSLYLVGEIRSLLRERYGRPSSAVDLV